MSDKLDELWENNPAYPKRQNKSQKKQANKHDLDGEKLVKCRLCLTEECRLDNLLRHVKKEHKKFWKKFAKRDSFVAK